MAEITHRQVKTNGINVHVAEAGEGPVVLLLHGFPESWYSWRHQLPALADAGYHAIAPDIRGYGQSDAPEAIEAYSMKELTADAIGILDDAGAETAVVVGHDWGAPMAWTSALLYPERVRAVGGLSVPFTPRSPAPPIQIMKQMFGDYFFYIIYFQEPGVAEAELEADVRRSMRIFMHAASGQAPEGAMLSEKKNTAKLFEGMPEPEVPSPWLSEADLDFYTSEFERTGFRGGLNRYRNMDRDWEELPELAGRKIEQPALFIAGEKDPVVRFTTTAAMKEHVTDLRVLDVIPGVGHWTQQEAADEVNAKLIEFLGGL